MGAFGDMLRERWGEGITNEPIVKRKEPTKSELEERDAQTMEAIEQSVEMVFEKMHNIITQVQNPQMTERYFKTDKYKKRFGVFQVKFLKQAKQFLIEEIKT